MRWIMSQWNYVMFVFKSKLDFTCGLMKVACADRLQHEAVPTGFGEIFLKSCRQNSCLIWIV